jgi:quercetin dioxygenase-like cupin family protein
MQSSTLIPKRAAHGGIAPVNFHGKQDAESARTTENQDGFIIVKKGEGVYYVRYDIIFAKAGDVFFMPRKVPQGFNLESDCVIPFTASAGEFEEFFNENFLPVEREKIRRFANLSASLQ